MHCGAGFRCDLDLAGLWLWSRPAATAPIQPLAWETPYASGAALKKKKKWKERKEGKRKERKKEKKRKEKKKRKRNCITHIRSGTTG